MKYIYTITTQDGTRVNLTMGDLAYVHNLYRFFATREYINNNYLTLTDRELDAITNRALTIQDSYDGYNEEDAIKRAVNEICNW